MKSKVYYIHVQNEDNVSLVNHKLERLLQASGIIEHLGSAKKACIKIHFGEEGNTGFVHPAYVAQISQLLKEKGMACSVADTNTLYRGRRTNAKDHLALARDHGFTQEAIGAQIIVPDEKSPDETPAAIAVNQRYIKIAKIAHVFVQADALIGLAHFKGHLMTGFGGALKNIGMGCATREGKLAQHSTVCPVVYPRMCTGCGVCILACPANAISLKDNKSQIDPATCIGCASCIAACPSQAIDVNWQKGSGLIQEKMIEYASAVLKNSSQKRIFLNFAIKITQECDCLAKDDPRIVPDVGIFASCDPVSIDKACYDMINHVAGCDIFRKVHPKRDPMIQLNYAKKLGLGNLTYELIEVG